MMKAFCYFCEVIMIVEWDTIIIFISMLLGILWPISLCGWLILGVILRWLVCGRALVFLCKQIARSSKSLTWTQTWIGSITYWQMEETINNKKRRTEDQEWLVHYLVRVLPDCVRHIMFHDAPDIGQIWSWKQHTTSGGESIIRDEEQNQPNKICHWPSPHHDSTLVATL